MLPATWASQLSAWTHLPSFNLSVEVPIYKAFHHIYSYILSFLHFLTPFSNIPQKQQKATFDQSLLLRPHWVFLTNCFLHLLWSLHSRQKPRRHSLKKIPGRRNLKLEFNAKRKTFYPLLCTYLSLLWAWLFKKRMLQNTFCLKKRSKCLKSSICLLCVMNGEGFTHMLTCIAK